MPSAQTSSLKPGGTLSLSIGSSLAIRPVRIGAIGCSVELAWSAERPCCHGCAAAGAAAGVCANAGAARQAAAIAAMRVDRIMTCLLLLWWRTALCDAARPPSPGRRADSGCGGRRRGPFGRLAHDDEVDRLPGLHVRVEERARARRPHVRVEVEADAKAGADVAAALLGRRRVGEKLHGDFLGLWWCGRHRATHCVDRGVGTREN